MLFTIGSHTINMDHVAYFEVYQHHLSVDAHLYVQFIFTDEKLLVMSGKKDDLDMKVVDIKEQMIPNL